MLNISSRGCFFVFFLYFDCRDSMGTNILSWVHQSILPKKINCSHSGRGVACTLTPADEEGIL